MTIRRMFGSYTVPRLIVYCIVTLEDRLIEVAFKERYAIGAVPAGAAFFMETLEKTCSCFGHYDVDITDDLKERTRTEIDRAIEDGVRNFLFGGRSDFDDLCYDLVTEKKNVTPELNLKRVFCFPLDQNLRKQPRWFVKKEYEALECPTKDFDYWYTSIYYRNLAMIDKSDLILFWVEERENSGAYKTYRYALKKHKQIVNLFQ